MELPIKRPEKIKLKEINPYLTCYLCKGYLIDATTISECLHSFCRSCIIRFLQDNSFCPVCEVIINKAKPNLKLDKTLQDIVYKLVPELFLKEMTRRKQFYQQYPQIASRISPEERGEDTERTIFNPQDLISLSIEYVSDDSTPGAICLPGSKNGLDKKNLTAEENQALMKRYLQCPGMCRVEVLKKFVRNKYNVDTNLFYIDILYKRVPLPDHYTLIDIAYIYSWKRNEPMKFYFRIIDINKVSERFDYFTASQTPDFVIKTPTRAPRNNSDRVGSAKKRESGHKRISKANKQASQERVIECDKSKSEVRVTHPGINCDTSSDDKVKNKCDNTMDSKGDKTNANKSCVESESVKLDNKKATSSAASVKTKDTNNFGSPETKMKEGKRVNEVKDTPSVSPTTSKSEKCAKSKEVSIESNLLLKPEIAEQIKNKIQNEKGDNKNSVYTNITLNRTNNVEIITKIQKVSNKEGRPIGLNIIKQTVKKGVKTRGNSPVSKTTKKVSSEKKKPETQVKTDKKNVNNNKIEMTTKNNKQISSDKKESTSELSPRASNSLEEEKFMFFKSIELTAKSVVENIASKQGEHVKVANGTKRKNSSSVKHDKSKKSKLDKKPTTKIIIQPKPPSQANPTVPANASLSVDQKRNCGLQSLIDSCKINIPSSLSITLKENNENRVPVLVPPVKNYIEILKLPDENSMGIDIDNKTETSKIDKSVSTLCDNDSEQKVDQDLSEIAKSLTEKIPMSTTVSQIVGPKPQFPIPVKSNVPVKFHIQPSPVPEVPCKVLNMPKDNKLSPRSPQTFQKIFEESIKKPDGTSQSPEKDPQKTALDLSNEPSIASNAKRNILEIASQLYKKTRLEHEKYQTEVKSDETSTPGPAPKVPIPRLPNQRTLKPPQKNSKFEVMDSLKFPQTLTNLHSNTLGLNYTISVGQSVTPKVNGIVSPARMDSETKPLAEAPSKSPGVTASSPNPFVPPIDLPSSSPRPNSVSRNMSPILGYNSPRNSPRHSPKSSPMVKHMYAPLPNIMDQLRVHTFNQKMPPSMLNTLSKLSPKLQTSSPKIHSPSKPPSSSPKLLSSSPKLPGSPTKVATSTSPKLANALPKPSLPQPSSSISVNPLQVGVSPKNASASPTSASSSKSAQKASPGGSQSSPLSPNQILEKYNIQNLAQLTASLNFNSGNFGLNPSNQLAALQHAMLLKHFEMQNRQNWLNMNQGPLLQYEKYLQSLKSNQNHLLGNIKEN